MEGAIFLLEHLGQHALIIPAKTLKRFSRHMLNMLRRRSKVVAGRPLRLAAALRNITPT
jgi:hypothetical protein